MCIGKIQFNRNEERTGNFGEIFSILRLKLSSNLPVLDIDFTVKFELIDEEWNDGLANEASRRHQNLSSELKSAVSS